MDPKPKVIAFYLPQFHAIPENDAWWGEGFTEWTNVKKARPLFEGHAQPRVPLHGRYYDLLDDAVKAWQVRLARENGVDGFCFYHYWFGGKRMLHLPLEQYLANRELTLPFCLCWANPPWTKIWAGEGSAVLIDQDYGGEEQWEAHFRCLLPFFRDERYIREDGCPLFVIYTPADIPRLGEMLSYFRERAVREGFGGLKLLYQYRVDAATDARLRRLFDYCIRFQPVYALHALETGGRGGAWVRAAKRANRLASRVLPFAPSDKLLRLRRADYDAVWRAVLDEPVREKDLPCAFVGFDNTPRRGQAGKVVTGASPEKFESYLRLLYEKARREYRAPYLFVTAWNEWSEGAYLEPDARDGCGYLRALRRAVRER